VETLLPALLFSITPFVEVPNAISFLFLVFMAVISTLSQCLLTKAYSASNLSIVGVISYANIPFVIGFSWILGDAFPDSLTFSGILVGLKK
jgi:drug/metabolite transporter (DMT)-like permease